VIAALALLLQGREHDRLEIAAQGAIDAARGRRLLRAHDDRGGRDGELAELVGRAAAEELVEHDAQGIDVAARVDRTRIGGALLRAHVGESAHELAHLRARRAPGDGDVRGARHAEVDHLGLPRGTDQHVPGLEVAVDDPVLVAVLHGLADPQEELDPAAKRWPGLGHVRIEGARAGHELHREVGHALAVQDGRAAGVDLRHGCVLQPAAELDLALETTQRLGRQEPAAHELERDRAARMVLFRLPDHAHAALADAPPQRESPDRPADQVPLEHAGGGDRSSHHDRPLQALPAVVGQQRRDLRAQVRVARAQLAQAPLLLGLGSPAHRQEDLLHVSGVVGAHYYCAVLPAAAPRSSRSRT
jgi:hypothetical protein